MSVNQLLLIFVTFGSMVPAAHLGRQAHVQSHWQAQFFRHTRRGAPARRGPPEDWEGRVPLVVTNQCDSKIWPGIATQSGTGPGTGGFELAPGKNKTMWVASNWQGRVWGRTNCTVNGESCACKTGDCFSKLDCEFSVSITMTSCIRFYLPFQTAADQLYGNREQRQQRSLNSILLAVRLGCRPFMTFRS